MRIPYTAVLVALTASLVSAQNPRLAQRVDASGVVFDPVVATSGDLSVAAYAGDNSIFVTTSDGRGLTWSAPVRVDTDTTFARKDLNNGHGDVHVSGDTISICWRDERAGTDVFFARSTDRGVTWSPDVNVTLALGVLPSASSGLSHRLAVQGDDVYVLIEVAIAGAPEHELFLFVSNDGGMGWTSPIYVPSGTLSGGGADVDWFDLAVVGRDVYVAWEDNRNGTDEVFFQKSTDGGSTWLPNDVQIDAPGDLSDADNGVFIDVRGGVVAIVWAQEPPGMTNEALYANVSTDGGATFGGETLIGNYTVGTDDVDNPWMAMSASGNIVVCWEDNRLGADEIYTTRSTDNGVTWSADVNVSGGVGGFPRLIEAVNEPAPSAGCAPNVTGDCDIILWTGPSFPDSALGSISLDGGATWGAPITLSTTFGDADFSEGAFNALYQNFIIGYTADDLGANNMYVGGVRPQTVDPVGWVAGRTNVGFTLSGFGSDSIAIVLVSQTPGAFPIPGTCKLMDVGLDAFFLATLGAFPVPLVGGAGASPTYRVRLPAGQTYVFSAVSVGATFNQVTDAGQANT